MVLHMQTTSGSLNPSELKSYKARHEPADDPKLDIIRPSKSLGRPTIQTLLPRVPQLIKLQSVNSSPLFQRRLRSMKCWDANDFDAGMSDDEDTTVQALCSSRELPKKAEGVKVSFSGDLAPSKVGRLGHSTGDLPMPPRCATVGALPPVGTLGATLMSKTLDLLPDDDFDVGSIPDSDASEMSPLSVISEDWNRHNHQYSPSNTSTQATFTSSKDLPPRRGAVTMGALPSMMTASGKSNDSGDRKRNAWQAPAPTSRNEGIQDIPGVAKEPKPISAISSLPRKAAQIPAKVPQAPRSIGSKMAWS